MNNKEYQLQKQLYVEALVEKDYMEIYEANLLKNDFILKLGEPKYELHRLEITIARTKLKLEMMQTCIKFNRPMDLEYIDRTLEKEFEKHYNMLKSMKDELEFVRNLDISGDLPVMEADEIKKSYYSIASFIHPEIADENDKKAKRMWNAAKKAYQQGDLIKLGRLQKKVMAEYRNISERVQLSENMLEGEVEALKEKTGAVISEIERLKKRFPFSEAEMLGDDKAVLKFKKDIDFDIIIAEEVLDKLEKQILENLPPTGKFLN